MSSSFIPKALPCISPGPKLRKSSLFITCQLKPFHNSKKFTGITTKPQDWNDVNKLSLAVQLGAFFATVEQPAYAITGVNNEEDLTSILIQLAILGFGYFIVMPPIIMNWLRVRWYRRKLLEMYLQFMFVFLFFPGVLLWAPFLNFRKFPRDPSMKYPWSTPQDPSKIRNSYPKFPFATPEDYDNF
ncbi:NAD(P)H-quinone oxidoreductase subunit L, chloroplastic isoform X2 [Euphorbia lathyris]|uniref:NAD(P)H-quinone oxidoreductase subunit L, chloroplastic isoform X2 n=1 Tax=Euphorbia lathyris TaxID=212925 RepID=UPI0033134E55